MKIHFLDPLNLSNRFNDFSTGAYAEAHTEQTTSEEENIYVTIEIDLKPISEENKPHFTETKLDNQITHYW